MSAPLDHAVVAVRDLDAAAARYQALGFTLTPRAEHPWGTVNRLAQFAGRNFIELLEIDRPARLFEHDPRTRPPTFSFGAFNRDYLRGGEGLSMLALAGHDSSADVARFRAAGLDTYAPFDFERTATLPDGSTARVAFSLAFATHQALPRSVFFTCHNRYPETFWKPDYQIHRNGVRALVEAVLVADDPARVADFLGGFSGGKARATDDDGGGISVDAGPHTLRVLTPASFEARYPGHGCDLSRAPGMFALAFAVDGERRGFTPAGDAGGVLLEWRGATAGSA